MNNIDEFALAVIRFSALRYHVGQEILCPRCHIVLDCREAVEVDFRQNDVLVATKICCSKCYDEHIKGILEKAATDPARTPGLTWDINDGRGLSVAASAPGQLGPQDPNHQAAETSPPDTQPPLQSPDDD